MLGSSIKILKPEEEMIHRKKQPIKWHGVLLKINIIKKVIIGYKSDACGRAFNAFAVYLQLSFLQIDRKQAQPERCFLVLLGYKTVLVPFP